MSLIILMYHSIADNRRDPHALHPDDFWAQLADLAQSETQVLSLSRAINERHKWIGRSAIALTFDDGYQDFLQNAAPILMSHQFPATVFVPTGLLGRKAEWDSYDKSKQLMDWDELGEVQRMGFDVGSHTISHPRLTECDDHTLNLELRASLDQLQEHLPEVVPLLSYPGGYFGRREMQAASAVGYRGAVGVASRFRNHFWTNPFQLRRRRWDQ